MGIGGIGANAVQGARVAGATNIIAIDPVAFKREVAQSMGATHVASDVDEAWDMVSQMTRGQLADKCIITTDVAEGAYVAQALSLVGKGGRVVVTSIGHPEENSVDMSLFELTLYEKEVRGALFGSGSPVDIPWILKHYQAGQVKLDELITTTYRLEDINQGFADMLDGKNIRGVVLERNRRLANDECHQRSRARRPGALPGARHRWPVKAPQGSRSASRRVRPRTW